VGRYDRRLREITGGHTVSMMNPLAGPAGPGKFSTRTDKLELGSTAYGEGVETQAIKSGSPLSTTPDTRPTPASEIRSAVTQTPSVGLFDESQRKSEPIQSGTDRPGGVGANALGMQKIQVKLSDSLATMLPFDTTGEITVLYQEALARGN
jgi:hypothetical protein